MELSPRLSAIASLAEMIEEFGSSHNIPDTPIFLVNLEIDELMTNYVTYSFRKVRRPRMEVTLRTFRDRLVLSSRTTARPSIRSNPPTPT